MIDLQDMSAAPNIAPFILKCTQLLMHLKFNVMRQDPQQPCIYLHMSTRRPSLIASAA
jgi:hypothetical protein